MNATTLSELRSAGTPRDARDEKMDQIRELLVGEDIRRSDARLASLEARLGALETDLRQRFDAVAARIEALAAAGEADRRTQLDDLSKAMFDLGDRLRMMARK